MIVDKMTVIGLGLIGGSICSAVKKYGLAGEVVGDYSLRLKRELGGDRLWVTAYANDAPC